METHEVRRSGTTVEVAEFVDFDCDDRTDLHSEFSGVSIFVQRSDLRHDSLGPWFGQ
jgi:hypothetical protein